MKSELEPRENERVTIKHFDFPVPFCLGDTMKFVEKGGKPEQRTVMEIEVIGSDEKGVLFEMRAIVQT